MTYCNGWYGFGFWAGMPYGSPSDDKYEDFEQLHNEISKENVIRHIEALDVGYCSQMSKDIFTGEEFYAGIIDDGPFVFPVDFLRYYKTRDIGIPYEYEAYLKSILE